MGVIDFARPAKRAKSQAIALACPEYAKALPAHRIEPGDEFVVKLWVTLGDRGKEQCELPLTALWFSNIPHKMTTRSVRYVRHFVDGHIIGRKAFLVCDEGIEIEASEIALWDKVLELMLLRRGPVLDEDAVLEILCHAGRVERG